MKFSFKSKAEINQSLEIVVPNKDIEEQVLSKLKLAQKDSKLKGFRKGKAPLNIVKKNAKNVIVISEKNSDKKASHKLSESDKVNIKKMINKLSIKEIISFIVSNSKVPKKEIYNYCLKLKNEN